MYYHKATIQYEGSNYAGFQWQKNLKTVQREFNAAISKIIIGKFSTMAASRTDSGVHAFEQIVKITTENQIDYKIFIESINIYLPQDIKCNKIEICSGQFRPAADSQTKEYRYFFTNKIQVPIENRRFIANISNKLNTDKILICIQALNGKHDFCNFYSSGSNVRSTNREIFLCELNVINPQEVFSNADFFQIPKDIIECYELRIIANGYLKQMIRHIVSALWMVGSGKLSVNDFLTLLNGPKIEKQKWKVASPNGLFLYKINYKS